MSIVPRTVEEIEVKYNGDKDGQDEIFIFRPGWLETIPSWRGSTNKNSIIYGLTSRKELVGGNISISKYILCDYVVLDIKYNDYTNPLSIFILLQRRRF